MGKVFKPAADTVANALAYIDSILEEAGQFMEVEQPHAQLLRLRASPVVDIHYLDVYHQLIRSQAQIVYGVTERRALALVRCLGRPTGDDLECDAVFATAEHGKIVLSVDENGECVLYLINCE